MGNPGQWASREGFNRDAGQRVSNPGHLGKAGTGGNPTLRWGAGREFLCLAPIASLGMQCSPVHLST